MDFSNYEVDSECVVRLISQLEWRMSKQNLRLKTFKNILKIYCISPQIIPLKFRTFAEVLNGD